MQNHPEIRKGVQQGTLALMVLKSFDVRITTKRSC